MAPKLPTSADREGLKLEFKRAEKLRTRKGREDLVRTIVAMKNTEGGTLWVGCYEENGRWNGFDPLAHGDLVHRDALRDLIVDAIEPLIDLGRSVRLEEVEQQGGRVLAIVIRKRDANAAPCCARFGNQREFLQRADDRNALIPYSELLLGTRTDSQIERDQVLNDLDNRCRKAFQTKPCLAFLVVPEARNSDPGFTSRVRGLLEAPDEVLDPLPGRGWHAPEYHEVEKKGGGLQYGRPEADQPYRVLRLERDGSFLFYCGLSWFRSAKATWGELLETPDYPQPSQGWLEEESLAPTIVSLTRLAARVSQELETPRVALVAALRDARGWGLRIRDVHSIKPGVIESAHLTTEVLVRASEDLMQAPDSVAFDLLRYMYEQVVDAGERELRATDFPWFQEVGVFSPPR